MNTVFYPYKTAPEAVELSILLDGVHDSPLQTIDLFEMEGSEFQFSVEVNMRPGALQSIIAESEREHPPVAMYFTLRSDESRLRESYRMEDVEKSSITMKLNRAKWSGEVEAQAFLVRTEASRDLPLAFGRDRGSALAWSEPVRILFDASPSPPGNEMTIKWESFAATMRAPSSNLFAIDTVEQAPAVVLNQDITNFQQVMTKLGTHGKDARVRDSTSYTIIHQVWSSLLGAIFVRLKNELEVAGESNDAGAVLGELGSLDESLVREWMPYFYPQMDQQSALLQILDDVRDPRLFAQLLTRYLPDAIQLRFNTSKGFEGLIKDFDRL